MRRKFLRVVVFSILAGLAGTSLVDAAGPGSKTAVKKKKSGPRKTVTTTVIAGDPEYAPVLTAEYKVVTVETRWLCFTRTSTQTTFTAVLDFTGYGLSDGDPVIFAFRNPGGPAQEIGTVNAVGQIATLTLSSKNGDQIPQIEEGASLAYDYTGLGFNVVEDFFVAPVTTVTTCGK